ncbi:MAG TPA: 4Fe-4S dicluster domain-containing protein [Thermoplasmata archaeon]|nr:4Fe-4S dicluster domain-containing protein [Thermoplasmata archaeon]
MEKPRAEVDSQECLACGGCISVCPEDAITMISTKAVVDKKQCIGCGICVETCPVGAIDLRGDGV